MKRRLRGLSTGVLRSMDRWLDDLPLFVMSDFRRALKEELLVRDLDAIAEEFGGIACARVRGVQ